MAVVVDCELSRLIGYGILSEIRTRIAHACLILVFDQHCEFRSPKSSSIISGAVCRLIGPRNSTPKRSAASSPANSGNRTGWCGESFMRLNEHLGTRHATPNNGGFTERLHPALTSREVEIGKLVPDRLTNKEIGAGSTFPKPRSKNASEGLCEIRHPSTFANCFRPNKPQALIERTALIRGPLPVSRRVPCGRRRLLLFPSLPQSLPDREYAKVPVRGIYANQNLAFNSTDRNPQSSREFDTHAMRRMAFRIWIRGNSRFRTIEALGCQSDYEEIIQDFLFLCSMFDFPGFTRSACNAKTLRN